MRSTSGISPSGPATADDLADEQLMAAEREPVPHLAVQPRGGAAQDRCPRHRLDDGFAGHRGRPAVRADHHVGHRLHEPADDGPVLPVEDADREAAAGLDQPAGDRGGVDGHGHQLGIGRHLDDEVGGHQVAPTAPSGPVRRPAADDVQPGRHRPEHPATKAVVAGRRPARRRSPEPAPEASSDAAASSEDARSCCCRRRRRRRRDGATTDDGDPGQRLDEQASEPRLARGPTWRAASCCRRRRCSSRSPRRTSSVVGRGPGAGSASVSGDGSLVLPVWASTDMTPQTVWTATVPLCWASTASRWTPSSWSEPTFWLRPLRSPTTSSSGPGVPEGPR